MQPMKLVRLTILVFFAAASVPARADDADATVVFDGVAFHQASDEKNARERLREYLPEGESFARAGAPETWTRLVSIREIADVDDPEAAARGLVAQRQAPNPLAPSQVAVNPSTGEVLVDFVTWPDDGSFSEFNVFKYAKARKGGGIVISQYARRSYGDEAREAFFAELKRERPRLVELMAKAELLRK